MFEMNPMRAAIALALRNLGAVQKRRPATVYGRGVRNCTPIVSKGHFGASLGKFPDTRDGMPVPPNAGPNYDKFKVGRQLHRALARMVLKTSRSKAKVEVRHARRHPQRGQVLPVDSHKSVGIA